MGGALAFAACTSLLLSAALWSRGPGPHAETVLKWGIVWVTALVLIALSVPAMSRLHGVSCTVQPSLARVALALPAGLLLGLGTTALSAAVWSLIDHAV